MEIELNQRFEMLVLKVERLVSNGFFDMLEIFTERSILSVWCNVQIVRKHILDFASPPAGTKAFDVDITFLFAVEPNVLKRLLKNS